MTSEQQTGEPWTVLARLVRPQGRHGEILADVLTDFPERFADRKRLFLVSSETNQSHVLEVGLEDHWLHKGRIVLKFSGIDSINDADALRGLLVAIPASERATLTDDSVYIGDLIGCTIFDVNAGSTAIGMITNVDADSCLLAVESANGEEVLIPFVKAYLTAMDLAGKRIEMRLPPGLLEINAPLTDEERRAQNASDKSK